MTEQADWEQTLGLAPDTTRVSLTCTKDDREEWSREASRQGYGSRSQYLYELIQEARAYREAGFLAHHDSDERIEDRLYFLASQGTVEYEPGWGWKLSDTEA